MSRLWLLTVCLLVAVPAFADDDMDPWTFERPVQEFPPRVHAPADEAVGGETSHPIKRGFSTLFNLWRDVLSPLDGPKCPHYPTCSQFSRESIGMYGPAWGLVMTGNRLAREYPGLLEGGEYRLIKRGDLRAYDPPEQEWLWGEYLNPPLPEDLDKSCVGC